MRSDNLKTHMKQHEKENYENETFYSTTSSTTSLDKVSDFSLDKTNKTYEVSPLEREEMTKRLIKEDEKYKYSSSVEQSVLT